MNLFLSRLYQFRYFILFLALNAEGKGISIKDISPDEITTVKISQYAITTLRFPAQVTGVEGLGLVQKADANGETEGHVHEALSTKGRDLVLNALDNTPVQMTVEMGGNMYVFNLVVGDDPDVVMTLSTDMPTDKKVVKVTDKEVKDLRPVFNDQLLSYWAELAHQSLIRRGSDPEEYQGYQKRMCDYIVDDGLVKTVVNTIHKFTDHDAIIVDGTVTNEQSETLMFDREHVGLAIQDKIHSVTWMPQPEPIAPGETKPITVEVVGDYEPQTRANFSISNEYRIEINTGYHKVQPEPMERTTPTPAPPPKVTPTPKPKPTNPPPVAKP